MLNGQARALWTWLCLIVTLLHGGIRAEAYFARPDQALGTLLNAASKRPDPMGHGASMSLYDFANGAPVHGFDPDGRLATGFAGGATLGDYYQPKKTAQRIGQFVGQTAMSFVPIARQAADVRDLSVAVETLQSEGLSWGTATGVFVGGLGIIPAVGDLVKGIAKPLVSSLPNSQTIQKLSSVYEAPIIPAPPTKVTDHVAGVVDDAERGTPGKALLPGEGGVGIYDDLIAAGRKGDNLTSHHIPSAKHMAYQGVGRGQGVSIMMEQPVPGVGGRHRATFIYGTAADAGMTSRDALAAGIRDARRIYMQDGLDSPMIRQQLQEVIRQNKALYPTTFAK